MATVIRMFCKIQSGCLLARASCREWRRDGSLCLCVSIAVWWFGGDGKCLRAAVKWDLGLPGLHL